MTKASSRALAQKNITIHSNINEQRKGPMHATYGPPGDLHCARKCVTGKKRDFQ